MGIVRRGIFKTQSVDALRVLKQEETGGGATMRTRRPEGSEVGPQKRQRTAAVQDAARLPGPIRRWDRNNRLCRQFLNRHRTQRGKREGSFNRKWTQRGRTAKAESEELGKQKQKRQGNLNRSKRN